MNDLDRLERLIVGIGLLVAVSAGLSGGVFESGSTQSLLYAVSSLGWVVGTALVSLRHARRGELVVAAGFVLLTIAEALLWVNGRPGDADYQRGFAGGTMFYVPGLLLVGLPVVYPIVIRVVAVLGAGVWAVGSLTHLTGGEVADTDPLALAGYSLLSIAFIGVAVIMLRARSAKAADRHDVPMIPSPASAE